MDVFLVSLFLAINLKLSEFNSEVKMQKDGKKWQVNVQRVCVDWPAGGRGGRHSARAPPARSASAEVWRFPPAARWSSLRLSLGTSWASRRCSVSVWSVPLVHDASGHWRACCRRRSLSVLCSKKINIMNDITWSVQIYFMFYIKSVKYICKNLWVLTLLISEASSNSFIFSILFSIIILIFAIVDSIFS